MFQEWSMNFCYIQPEKYLTKMNQYNINYNITAATKKNYNVHKKMLIVFILLQNKNLLWENEIGFNCSQNFGEGKR